MTPVSSADSDRRKPIGSRPDADPIQPPQAGSAEDAGEGGKGVLPGSPALPPPAPSPCRSERRTAATERGFVPFNEATPSDPKDRVRRRLHFGTVTGYGYAPHVPQPARPARKRRRKAEPAPPPPPPPENLWWMD